MSGNRGYKRADRVARGIQRGITDILRNEISDPALRKLVITDVTMSDDLKNATIYWQPLLPDENFDITPVNHAFSRALKRMRSLLSTQMQLRYTPRLRFKYDATIDEARRIDGLIRSLNIPEPTEGPEPTE